MISETWITNMLLKPGIAIMIIIIIIDTVAIIFYPYLYLERGLCASLG